MVAGIGLVLTIIGSVVFLIAFTMAVKEHIEQNKKSKGLDPANWAKLLEQFAKLSIWIQWGILGLIAIYIGAKLMGMS